MHRERGCVRQLTQKLKDGRVQVIDVPAPTAAKGMIVVRSAFSVISAGTEGSTVRAARKSLIGKARERPQQAKQMLDLLKQSGPVQAYRTFEKKLNSYSPLGYSSAGVIIDLGEGVTGFSLGDKVACAGRGANHAEIVTVPQNLCVKLAADADLKTAAYNTLGSIALQGIRQADLRLGEACVVIGLGLLGQITCLLLRAAGNRVLGVDIDPEMVRLAAAHAADFAASRDEPGLAEKIDEFTGGLGVDAVIITAATDSTDPVNFAGRVLKKKGRVVVVGSVPTGFDREPYFYQKELDLRMSCSYGPGRYDPAYEEKGIDYPPAYVRWTERRNMEIFQEFVHSGRIDLSHLTTHVFKLDDAGEAYDFIMGKKAPHLGILIQYEDSPIIGRKVPVRFQKSAPAGDSVGIAFVGAGSYAMSHLLPNLPKRDWLKRLGVMTSSGLSSRTVSERFEFEHCTSDEKEIFQNDAVNTVFIATRHDSHAGYVVKSLKAGKNVFVEKPLCISEAEFGCITEAAASPESAGRILMVGFNRRFSPLTAFIREKIGTGPMSMIYRINAGALPADSWIHDIETSGGRIVGEACHFIDYLTYLNGSLPTKVQAFGLPDPKGRLDTVSINISFGNGSIGTVAYFANGPKNLPKEYVEIYRAGTAAILTDFSEAAILTGGKKLRKKLLFQDKGQSTMVDTFLNAVRRGDKCPISFDEISTVTLACFRVEESMRSGSVLSV